MYLVELDDDEVAMLMAALMLVTPTGGGGRENSLGMKIAEVAGFTPDLDLVKRFFAQMLSEAVEASGPNGVLDVDDEYVYVLSRVKKAA